MQVRIQFGERKGKKLTYPSDTNARPTLARARDVLFNWLIPFDYKKVCDLFAGTGILGLEALSLGAQTVHFIDCQKTHLHSIRKAASDLNLKDRSAICTHDDAFSFIDNQQQAFDLIFADPPFDKNYHQKLLDALFKSAIADQKTLIYLESDKQEIFDSNWRVLKEKKIAKVRIYLIQKA